MQCCKALEAIQGGHRRIFMAGIATPHRIGRRRTKHRRYTGSADWIKVKVASIFVKFENLANIQCKPAVVAVLKHGGNYRDRGLIAAADMTPTQQRSSQPWQFGLANKGQQAHRSL